MAIDILEIHNAILADLHSPKPRGMLSFPIGDGKYGLNYTYIDKRNFPNRNCDQVLMIHYGSLNYKAGWFYDYNLDVVWKIEKEKGSGENFTEREVADLLYDEVAEYFLNRGYTIGSEDIPDDDMLEDDEENSSNGFILEDVYI